MRFIEDPNPINSGQEYDRLIHSRPRSKLLLAFEQALENRRAEINLYWTRAAYFWAFIVVIFGAFFTISNADHLSENDKSLYQFIICCGGLVFSFAWYLVNRGSKYWQENWEKHVDMLERKVYGRLYRTTLDHEPFTHFSFTGPLPISVTRVNEILSLFVWLIWIYLWANTLHQIVFFFNPLIKTDIVLIALTTIGFLFFLFFGSKRKTTSDFKFRTGRLGR